MVPAICWQRKVDVVLDTLLSRCLSFLDHYDLCMLLQVQHLLPEELSLLYLSVLRTLACPLRREAKG